MIKLNHRIPNQYQINTKSIPNHHKSSQNQFKSSQFNIGSQKHGKTQPSDPNSIEILKTKIIKLYWVENGRAQDTRRGLDKVNQSADCLERRDSRVLQKAKKYKTDQTPMDYVEHIIQKMAGRVKYSIGRPTWKWKIWTKMDLQNYQRHEIVWDHAISNSSLAESVEIPDYF